MKSKKGEERLDIISLSQSIGYLLAKIEELEKRIEKLENNEKNKKGLGNVVYK